MLKTRQEDFLLKKNLPAPLVVEQDLTSSSTTSIPSVKAVADALTPLTVAVANIGASIKRLTEFTVTGNGAQAIPIKTTVITVFDLVVLEYSGLVRAIYPPSYNVVNGQLVISVDANLRVGDKISGSYISSTALPTSTPGSTTTFPYTIPVTLS